MSDAFPLPRPVPPDLEPLRAIGAACCADDLPASMSRVLKHYAWQLCDVIPDEMRPELLAPIVMYLPGTASTREMEFRRAEYIALETVRRINAYVCRHVMEKEDWATRCEAVGTVREAWLLVQEIQAAAARDPNGVAGNAEVATHRALLYADNYETFIYTALDDGLLDYYDYVPTVCGNSANVVLGARNACRGREVEVLTTAVSILDGAIRLGRP